MGNQDPTVRYESCQVYLCIHHMGIHITPVSFFDAPLNRTDHARTDITTSNINRLARICVRLLQYFSLSPAPTSIVEDTRVCLHRRQQSQKLELTYRERGTNRLGNMNHIGEVAASRSLASPGNTKAMFCGHVKSVMEWVSLRVST